MSLRVMTWAWGTKLPPASKLLLMALADEADDSGYCFPSQRRLAVKCGITDRTVRRLIVELQAKGHVRIEHRYRPDGSPTSNGYRLLRVDPPDKTSGGADTHVRGARTRVSGGADTHVLRPTTYPLSNPPPPPPPPPPPDESITSDHRAVDNVGADRRGGGDRQFPKALTAGQIGALHDILTGIDSSQVQQVLDELAGRMQVGSVTNPIRYCATLVQRLKCARFTPELGIRIAEARAAERQRIDAQTGVARVDGQTVAKALQGLPEELRASLERIRARTAARALDVHPAGESSTDPGP